MGNVIEKGPSVGKYRDCEIPEFFIDDQGVRYNYIGLAPETPRDSGQVYMDDLEADESLLYPGLLYKRAG